LGTAAEAGEVVGEVETENEADAAGLVRGDEQARANGRSNSRARLVRTGGTAGRGRVTDRSRPSPW
jgi:hypothetical protein